MKWSMSSRFLAVGCAALLVSIAAGPRLLADGANGDDRKQDRKEDRDDRGQGHDNDDPRIKRGFDISPVPLNLRGRNRELVGLGSYLVNAVGGCNDCHTSPAYAPGGNPHLGEPTVVNATNYLAGGQAFGPFISRNLTPDPTSRRPANLTLDEFITIMRTGIDDDAVPPNVPSASNDLLQVMPWPVYQNMTTRELRAIYEYLSAIPHAEPPAAP